MLVHLMMTRRQRLGLTPVGHTRYQGILPLHCELNNLTLDLCAGFAGGSALKISCLPVHRLDWAQGCS